MRSIHALLGAGATALALASCAPAAPPVDQVARPPAAVALDLAAPNRPEADRALDASRKPAEVMAFLGVRPGWQVLEFLAGSGYFAEMLARAVGPTGSVLAVNPPGLGARVAPAMAERKARLPNITTLDAQFDDVRLAPASLDAALFHLTYHDAYWESAQFGLNRSDPARLLRELFAAMRPGGVVVVIDHVGRPGVDPRVEAEATHRIDPAVVRADFARAGFRLEAESQAWRVDGDDPAKSVFDAGLRGRTDRVAYRFRKPR